jgi:hypothetical protein
MTKLDLPIEDLLLDLDNPRLRTVATQSEALEAIVRLSIRHFRTMMQSIHQHGLDPGDSFYVLDLTEESDGYIVVDGNRRLAALKVLSEPAVLQSTKLPETTIKQLTKAAAGFERSTVEPISCVVFESRADADDWILRRHGRGMEGEARIHWGTLEIQRFQKDRTVLDVIDFVERNSTFDDDRWRQIKSVVEAKPSVLRRFLDSRKGRDWLGIAISDENGEKVPTFARDAGFVLNVLTRILEDIRQGEIDTRTHNKAEDIVEYFEDLPEQLHPAQPKAAAATRFRDAEIRDAESRPRLDRAGGATDAKSRTTRTKPPRRTLAPGRHPFAQPSTTKGQQLLREANLLRLRETPLACAFVLRAFLQHTIDIYMTREGLPFWENNKQLELKVRAERVLDHLIKSGRVKAQLLRGVRRTLTASTDPASIQALNDYHHDRYQVPAADVLRSAWDTAEPLFVAVYGPA